MTDRRKVWLHNSYLGHCRRIEIAADRIMNADTTTRKAKVLAKGIGDFAKLLYEELKERVDE